MNRINKKTLLIWLLVLLTPSILRGASLMERIKESYSKIYSIQADFTQETTLGVKKRMTYKGKVYIVPGKSLWDYQTPQPQLVWTQGDTFVLYDPVNKEAVKGVLDKEAIVTRGPFFSLINQIQKYYDVEEGKGDTPLLILSPKNTHSPIQKVTIHFNPKTLLIEKVETLDSLGNLNTVSFQNIRVNTTIPPKTFQINLPPNVKISQP